MQVESRPASQNPEIKSVQGGGFDVEEYVVWSDLWFRHVAVLDVA